MKKEELDPQEKAYLVRIRAQCMTMYRFMAQTPGEWPKLHWTHDMPAYPEDYTPDGWARSQHKLLSVVWEEYLEDLLTEISEVMMEDRVLAARLLLHLDAAEKLNLKELLEDEGNAFNA